MKRCLFVCCVLLYALSSSAQDTPIRLEAELDRVASNLTDHQYELRYKLRSSEQLYYQVIHQVAVQTTVQGEKQDSKSYSKSVKIWHVLEPDENGHTRFTHSVDFVKMWSETTGRDTVRYDSRVDKEVPADYRHVAETLGKPISTLTITSSGKEIRREDRIKQHNFGTGGMMIPLPEKPIRVGDKWSSTDFAVVRQSDGAAKRINTRVLYRLEKVETGVATISIRTEVLTPFDDSRMKSQLIQRLSNGTVRFDIDAGRVVSRQLDWNETVVGFNGPESNMAYLARMTETLVTDRVAARP